METKFHFSGFTPDDEVRFEADLTLEKILDLAPYGSVAVALLKKENESYHGSIEVYSRCGPFIANAVQLTPLLVVHHLEKVLTDKIRAWKKKQELMQSRKSDGAFKRAGPGELAS